MLVLLCYVLLCYECWCVVVRCCVVVLRARYVLLCCYVMFVMFRLCYDAMFCCYDTLEYVMIGFALLRCGC